MSLAYVIAGASLRFSAFASRGWDVSRELISARAENRGGVEPVIEGKAGARALPQSIVSQANTTRFSAKGAAGTVGVQLALALAEAVRAAETRVALAGQLAALGTVSDARRNVGERERRGHGREEPALPAPSRCLARFDRWGSHLR